MFIYDLEAVASNISWVRFIIWPRLSKFLLKYRPVKCPPSLTLFTPFRIKAKICSSMKFFSLNYGSFQLIMEKVSDLTDFTLDVRIAFLVIDVLICYILLT